jgi:hypothetical protein
MTVKISRNKTKRFLDYWAYVPGIIALFLLALLLLNLFSTRIIVDRTVKVTEEEPLKVATIELTPRELGALRIDVKSFFPDNHWVIYEIQLVDRDGQIIASAMDEAWRESGTWREGRESGTWSESDRLGGLDIRSQQVEQLEVVIEILESGTVSGQPTDLTVSFEVKIKKGVIASGHLWWGILYTTAFSILALLATRASGNRVIAKTVADSDPKARAIIGGEDNLIRVKINTKLDENSPRSINICLTINDVYGERIYQYSQARSVTLVRSVTKSDSGRIIGGKATLEMFLILSERGSYSFQVKIEPDNPVDKTSLIVRENAKTLTSVDVVEISPVPLSVRQQHFTME